MATVAAAEAPRLRGPQAPSPAVIQSVAVLGLSAGSLSFLFALTSDHVNEPGLQAALMDWVTLPYILGGLVAWWRRPDSRFGILMILAGFTMFLSNLAWTNVPVLHTIGQAWTCYRPRSSCICSSHIPPAESSERSTGRSSCSRM